MKTRRDLYPTAMVAERERRGLGLGFEFWRGGGSDSNPEADIQTLTEAPELSYMSL